MRRLAFGSWQSFTASITFLVIVGLFVVPVECSVAAGPHSLFIAAREIAALQVVQLDHGGHPGTGHHHHAGSPGQSIPSDPAAAGDPPSPAELTAGGAAALVAPAIDSTLIAPPPLPLVSRDLSIPPDSLRAGPEPPPP
jgi:hypothetical protein